VNSSRLEAASVEALLQEYQRAASAHGKAILEGDHEAANRHYEDVAACSRELKQRGGDTQELLLSLLKSSDPEIRYCAAIDALDFAPEMGEEELKKLVESNAVCGLNAYAILKQRGRSDIRFPTLSERRGR
jgi:hypothetical protein